MKDDVRLIFSLIRQQTEMEGGEIRVVGDGLCTTATSGDESREGMESRGTNALALEVGGGCCG